MPWDKMTTEDKITILIVVVIGLLLLCVTNLFSLGIF
jgi:hypothetical protein